MKYQQEATHIEQRSEATLGIDLGGDAMRLGVVSAAGEAGRIRRVVWGTESKRDGHGLISRIVAEARESMGGESTPIAAIGIAVPGVVDRQAQRVVASPAGWSLDGLDLRREVADALSVPVFLENTARAATRAEVALGVGRSVADMLYLHPGSSVGAGLVLGGRLQEGASGMSGGIGRIGIYVEHLATSMALEDLVSSDNIVRRTEIRLRRDATSSLSRLAAKGGFTWNDIIAEAHHGDELARLMIERTGMYIAIAIADVIGLLNLSMIAIGGAVPARQLLADAISRHVSQRLPEYYLDSYRIVPATVGGEAATIGAALAARQDPGA